MVKHTNDPRWIGRVSLPQQKAMDTAVSRSVVRGRARLLQHK